MLYDEKAILLSCFGAFYLTDMYCYSNKRDDEIYDYAWACSWRMI